MQLYLHFNRRLYSLEPPHGHKTNQPIIQFICPAQQSTTRRLSARQFASHHISLLLQEQNISDSDDFRAPHQAALCCFAWLGVSVNEKHPLSNNHALTPPPSPPSLLKQVTCESHFIFMSGATGWSVCYISLLLSPPFSSPFASYPPLTRLIL